MSIHQGSCFRHTVWNLVTPNNVTSLAESGNREAALGMRYDEAQPNPVVVLKTNSDGQRYHAGWNAARCRILVTSLGVQPRIVDPVAQAKVEPEAASAAEAVARDSSKYLVGRNNAWEHPEEGIHDQHRHKRGLRKFQHTPVVSDRTYEVGIQVMK